ncbi:MAG TPA: four helix bundle protein [Thermoanaerobaculia bacterium]|jgi:four helix bundle protein|nr:four helix bundle protein [Thermoanaerobaculia bacterium]
MSTTFENLRAFQRALDLMCDVYEATRDFPKAELYGLTSQLRRAAGSVVGNIAEGQGRLTYGEWRQHLSEARGSLYEVQAHMLAAHKLGFLGAAVTEHLKKRARMAAVELQGLIVWVRKRELDTKRCSGQKPQATNNQQPTTRD